MKEKNVIVVGGDHYNTLCVARSLGSVGYNPIIIFYGDFHRSFVQKSKYVKDFFFSSNREELYGNLRKLGRIDCKQLLITTSDATCEMIDSQYDEFSKLFYLPNCHKKQGELSFWMKKKKMLDAAQRAGFNIGLTLCLNLESDYSNEIKGVKFPCIVKPAISCHGSKDDFRFCKSEDDLRHGLEEIKTHCPVVLVQEYLKPDYEVNVVGVSVNNKCILPGLTHKVKTCKSVNDMGMIVMSYVADEYGNLVTRDLVERFIHEIGYSGLFSLDLLISNGKLYFLEINLRSDGTMYMHTAAGVNFPQIWVQGNLNKNITVPISYKRPKTWGMTEISYIKYLDWKHPVEAIKDWWKTDCYSIFSWKDPLPFIYKFIYAL